MRALIIGSSIIYDYERLLKKLDLKNMPYDLIIVSDGGIKHLKFLSLKCDVLIGDFDSITISNYIDFLNENSKVLKYNSEKNETDMLISVEYVLNLGYKEIDIIGATNLRFDHTYANLQTLNYILKKDNNVTARIIDEYNIIRIIKDCSLKLNPVLDVYISFFAFSDYAYLTLKNLKYCIENYKLVNDFPLGVSNEFIKDKFAYIEVINTVIMIYSDKI